MCPVVVSVGVVAVAPGVAVEAVEVVTAAVVANICVVASYDDETGWLVGEPGANWSVEFSSLALATFPL